MYTKMMHDMAEGSRRQVMNGTAHHTAGDCCKSDLMKKKTSAGVRYVSKAAHMATLHNPKAMAWIKVCADYRKKHKSKDGIVLMPKKGTAEHRKMVAAYRKKIAKR